MDVKDIILATSIAKGAGGGSGGGVTKEYVDSQVGAVSERVDDVEDVIPSTATPQNPLATATDVSETSISFTSTTSPITDSADGMVQGLTIYGRSKKSKNLLEITAGSRTSKGITYTVDKTAGTVTANGTSTDISTFVLTLGPIQTNLSGYILSGCPQNQNICKLSIEYIDLPYTELAKDTGNSAIVSDYDGRATTIFIRFNPNQTISNLVFKPMICTAADYEADPTFEPYFEGIKSIGDDGLTVTTANSDNTVTTSAEFTTALPLRGVSDTVRDKLICTAESKQVETVCGEVDLGTQTITFRSTTSDIYNTFRLQLTNIDSFVSNSQPPKLLSSKFEPVAWSVDWQPNQMSILSSDKSAVVFTTPKSIATVEDFMTYVSGTHLIYVLATPTVTPLTTAEISAFRRLKTYDSTTNITITDEPDFELDYLKNTENGQAVSDIQKDLQGQINEVSSDTTKVLSEAEILAQINDRIYQGVDLTQKFAAEIVLQYNNDHWAWIKARIQAENFAGIHVCDYIPFTTTNGITLNAQVAGINPYKNYGDSPVGAHIDFICKELWPTLHPVNKVNYNNGTSAQRHPWLASDLYLYLNSLSGDVPTGTTVNPETVAVDYTADGVYYFLPTQLKNVIIEKKFLLPTRYSASGLLSDDNSWDWKNIGKLWLPDECEVYCMPVWGGKGGYSLGGSALQYPLFAGNMNRLKFRNGSRRGWRLLSPSSGNSTSWCYVDSGGGCSYDAASDPNVAALVCFRVG